MLARQRQAYILDRVREDGGGPGRGPRARARRVRHDRPARPRDPRRARTAREGPRRRDVAQRERPVRAGFRGEVGAPAGARRTPSPTLPSPWSSPGMAIGVSAGTTTYALAQRLADVPRLTVVTNSVPRRGRAVPGRAGGPDDHPDRRRADAVGCARGAVRRGGPAHGPRGPRLRRRPRHGSALRVHLPQPARGRDRPGAHRGGPAPRRRRRPHQVGRHRHQLDRPARPGRHAHHRRRASAPRPGRSCPSAVRELVVGRPAGDAAAPAREARRDAH